MTNQIKRLSYIFILLCFHLLANAQGLQFSSINKLIANRTAYDVFDSRAQMFNEYVEISFKLAIVDPNILGYILHLKDLENEMHYNLSYKSDKDSLAYLNLSVQNKSILLQIPIEKNTLGSNKWHKVSIKFDAKSAQIIVRLNDETYKVDTEINDKILLELFFGKHEAFIDLPEMAIKDLKVNGKKKSFYFPFMEFNGNIVHDKSGKPIGTVENPLWLINKSYYWKLRNTVNSESVCAINFNEEKQRFITINKDSIYFFDLSSNQNKIYPLPNHTPVPMRLGMSFIPEGSDKMYIYELNDVEVGKPTIAAFDLNNNSWENCCTQQLDKQKHHHISHFQKEENKFWIFGGFGNQHFSNEFYAFDLALKEWTIEKFTGDELPPRFFSGTVPLNNEELILFGGVGNPSGDIIIGKIYYTDCYKINLKKRTIEKLWEIEDFNQQMVSGRNLIISEDSLSFYSIYYKEYISNTYLNVYKFDISSGAYEIVGDSIPMISERIRTNTSLYKNKQTNELYCVNQVFQLSGSSEIKIYSMLTPPVARTEFNEKQLQYSKNNALIIILISITLALCILLLLYLRKKRKHEKINEQRRLLQQTDKKIILPEKAKKNAIYVFGSFLVYDSNGIEISHLFSPKILQLFLLILLNSKDKKVSSIDIYEALWPDKPIKKARNSKGVTLNQLRKILLNIEGVELQNEHKHLYFEFSEPFYCDILEFFKLLGDLPNENSDIEKISEKIINIVSEGRFLLCSDEDCFDKHKRFLENEILKIVPYQLEKSFKEHNYMLTVKLVRILYKIDKNNELAFHFELLSYVKLDMNEKARKKFNAFIIDYKKENNYDYPHTYRDLVSHKSLEIIKEKSFI